MSSPRVTERPSFVTLLKNPGVGLVSKIYAFTGDLKSIHTVVGALLQAGIRLIPAPLQYLANCHTFYEMAGSTILHDHVRADNVQALRRDLPVLALNNPNVRDEGGSGDTLLTSAVAARAEHCVEYLLAHPKIVTSSTLVYGGVKVASVLDLALGLKGETIDADADEEVRVTQAARRDRGYRVVLLLLAHPTLVRCALKRQSTRGSTPLSNSICNQNKFTSLQASDLVQRLVDLDVSRDTLHMQNHRGFNPLMRACCGEVGNGLSDKSRAAMVSSLLRADRTKQSLYAQNMSGFNALAIMCSPNPAGVSDETWLALLTMLVKADVSGVSVSTRIIRTGECPLMLVCGNDSLKSGTSILQAASMLLGKDTARITTTIQDIDGWNASMHALYSGVSDAHWLQLLTMLLDHDTSNESIIQFIRLDGCNLLMLVVGGLSGHDQGSAAIVQAVAKVLDKDTSGQSIFHRGHNGATIMNCINQSVELGRLTDKDAEAIRAQILRKASQCDAEALAKMMADTFSWNPPAPVNTSPPAPDNTSSA